MEKIIYILSNETGDYIVKEYTKRKIPYLVNFFRNITIEYISFYITWALDKNNIAQAAGNTAVLSKKGSNILIGFLYSEQSDGGLFFELSIDQFIKLLQEWEKLVAAKTEKITITQNDDDSLTIEGE